MPVEVRSTRTMAEAAGILSADRNARLLSGGTLVMRDVNEGRLTEGTLVRLLDPAYARIETGGGRIEIGAGATMAALLARPELAFLHPAARAVGGPAVRNMATVGGNLFAPRPMATSLWRCWRLMRRFCWRRATASRARRRWRSFLRHAKGAIPASWRRRRLQPPRQPRRPALPEGVAGQAEGARSTHDRGAAADSRRPGVTGARRLWRDGACSDAGPRRGGEFSRARRSTPARSPPPRPRRSRARGRRPTRSPATGIAARCCRCISAAARR